MKIKKALVVYYVHNYKSLKLVQETLGKNNILFKCIRRVYLRKFHLKNIDLVITVGGDGTFLRTSHAIDKTPVLAVSSDVKINEAFFSRASKDDFKNKLKLLLKGKFKITKIPRLQAKINGEPIPMLAVNEIFVGSKHPYHTSRYILNVKGKSEFQKSSGVLVTTKYGSSGWAKSAIPRKKLSIPKQGFGYVVREPYSGRLIKPQLRYGYLSENDKLRITSFIHKGIVVVDSSGKEFKFIDGNKLEVKISKSPLNYIEF